MNAPDADRAWRQLVDRASARYRPAGRFAMHWARGKLTHDPAFRALLTQGWLAESSRLLDLGCGLALLGACVAAARAEGDAARWGIARVSSYTGIDAMARDIARAHVALEASCHAIVGDIRLTPFPACDTALVLDVLHYVDYVAQQDILTRLYEALSPGGVLLLRIGDHGSTWQSQISLAVDRLVLWLRGGGRVNLYPRALSDWVALVERIGWQVTAHPMSAGTPFTNVLLIARKGVC